MTKKEKSFLIFALVVTALFAVYVCFFSHGSVVQWVRASRVIKQQEEQIAFYESEIARMQKEADLLRSDRDSLEKFAREKLHFAAPGEDVYIEE